jgi:hypothetical protein
MKIKLVHPYHSFRAFQQYQRAWQGVDLNMTNNLPS